MGRKTPNACMVFHFFPRFTSKEMEWKRATEAFETELTWNQKATYQHAAEQPLYCLLVFGLLFAERANDSTITLTDTLPQCHSTAVFFHIFLEWNEFWTVIIYQRVNTGCRYSTTFQDQLNWLFTSLSPRNVLTWK